MLETKALSLYATVMAHFAHTSMCANTVDHNCVTHLDRDTVQQSPAPIMRGAIRSKENLLAQFITIRNRLIAMEFHYLR
jgi:hypothetical protein